MIAHPRPLLTYFKGNKPRIYKRVDNKVEWEIL